MAPAPVSDPTVVTLDVNVIARLLPVLERGYAGVRIPTVDQIARSGNGVWRQGGNPYRDVFSMLVHEVATAAGELKLVLHQHELDEAVEKWTRKDRTDLQDVPHLSPQQAADVVEMLTELAVITGGEVQEVDTSRAHLRVLSRATGCTDWADDLKVIAGLDGVHVLVTADGDLIKHVARGRHAGVLSAVAVEPWNFAA